MDQAEYFTLCRRLATEFVSHEADRARVVWAKIRSYPTWPGQVLAEEAAAERLQGTKRPKEAALPIMFFGDCSVAWVRSAGCPPA